MLSNVPHSSVSFLTFVVWFVPGKNNTRARFDLSCVGMRGHFGWNKEPSAAVPLISQLTPAVLQTRQNSASGEWLLQCNLAVVYRNSFLTKIPKSNYELFKNRVFAKTDYLTETIYFGQIEKTGSFSRLFAISIGQLFDQNNLFWPKQSYFGQNSLFWPNTETGMESRNCFGWLMRLSQ